MDKQQQQIDDLDREIALEKKKQQLKQQLNDLKQNALEEKKNQLKKEIARLEKEQFNKCQRCDKTTNNKDTCNECTLLGAYKCNVTKCSNYSRYEFCGEHRNMSTEFRCRNCKEIYIPKRIDDHKCKK